MIIYGLIYLFFKLSIVTFFLFSFLLAITQLIYYKLKNQKNKQYPNIKIVSFVHPFCADCGGGEKVLWRIITSLIDYNNQNPNNVIKVNIISGRKDDLTQLKDKLKSRFNIDFNKPKSSSFVLDVELVKMKNSFMLQPQSIATMILQILGQIFFAFEIITTIYSDVYCDTTGLPFTYAVLKIFGHSKVTAYTHYPFISYDMISEVENNISGVHSRGVFSKISILKKLKILYYKSILFLYKFMGMFVTYAQCNSSWTYNHMVKIWTKTKLDKVYPPCSTGIYGECSKNKNRQNLIVSFAQFRPEKNQKMQIQILKKLIDTGNFPDLQLHIIGAVRGQDDEILFNKLQIQINNLNLQNNIKLIKNAPFQDIINEFANAKIGIHTMRNEHFGISIIEMMAAGLIVITHNSAGAKDDIIGPVKDKSVGILVDDENGYVEQISNILSNYSHVVDNIVPFGIQRANGFSDEAFEEKIKNVVFDLL